MNFDIRADLEKNRLYVIMVGFFTDDQVREAVEKTREEINKLQSGFDVITDISKFKPATPEGAKEIARGQQMAVEHGVNRAIRVVGNVIGQMQFERLGRKTQLEANTAATIEDAEKLLDAE